MVANQINRSSTLARLRRKAKREGWARYIRTENDERALLAGYTVSMPLGQHVVDFFAKYLRHSKGKWNGKPFVLHDIQIHDIIMPLFGWIRPDGTRRFRKLGIWVAKKNFKSTLGSGLSLYMLIGDGEPGAECYLFANDREQAGIVYRGCADMVEASPQLRAKLEVTRSSKTISYQNNAWIRALSSEANTAEGLNIHFALADELHAFTPRGRILFEAIRHGDAARDQALIGTISTAGDDDEGFGKFEYDYHKSVLEGHKEDLHTFVYIAEADENDDPGAVETWRKANPMLGVTVSEENMRDAYNQAKDSPRRLANFWRYRLNRWVKTSEPWLNMDRWAGCGGEIDEEALIGLPCWGAVDLAFASDFSAWVIMFREAIKRADEVEESDDDELAGNASRELVMGTDAFRYIMLAHFFIAEDGIAARQKKDGIDYMGWVDAGMLTLTPGNITDYNIVEQRIRDDVLKYKITSVGYDPYACADMAVRLKDNHGVDMVLMRQGGFTLGAPTKAFERIVMSERLNHGDNPMLRLQASQCCTKSDTAGNIWPIKGDGKKKHWRIDGIVAGIMALGRSMMDSPVRKKSVYEGRGLVEI